MSKSKTPRVNYISYYKTLINYEGIQLFVALGRNKRKFICLAVPNDIEDQFLCAPVTDFQFCEYMYERIDLYALFMSSTSKYYLISFQQEDSRKGFPLRELTEIPADWLPDRQVFARCHTDIYPLHENTEIANLEVRDREIHIDGRWDAEDLSELPDLFRDNYSFLYALEIRDQKINHRTTDMFRKFPWRGGFSTVGFYQGLYDQVPRAHRLEVQGISYHSPGEITLSSVSSVVDSIDLMACTFNNESKDLKRTYKELYEGMSLRQLLGRSLEEIDPTDLDIKFVEKYTSDLAAKMGFKKLDQLLSLTDNNWISAAKILMSYFRRIKLLADFIASGKATIK